MLALVIDDSKTTRMILRRMLKELGFEVEEAENGQEALAQLESSPLPNIALVDWNMPIMDGYQFVKSVRSKAKFNKLLLMMVTTETELDRLTAAIEAGVDEYVMKPFTKEVIEEKFEILGLVRD
ncbi:MAG: response regulator [Acidimicrobiaceae bacterium]|nr:response regulator [Acidimicrobiaceae bacterium]